MWWNSLKQFFESKYIIDGLKAHKFCNVRSQETKSVMFIGYCNFNKITLGGLYCKIETPKISLQITQTSGDDYII